MPSALIDENIADSAERTEKDDTQDHGDPAEAHKLYPEARRLHEPEASSPYMRPEGPETSDVQSISSVVFRRFVPIAMVVAVAIMIMLWWKRRRRDV